MAHKTNETINPSLDTTMSIAERDELSNVHIELAMGHTTIKNLSEVVVNFSHTGKVSTYQQDEVVKKHQPSPKLTPPNQPSTCTCTVLGEISKPSSNQTHL